MAYTIFYFTGTGSSLAVSKKVATLLGGCSIRSITSYSSDEKILLSGVVGFVFPNYYATIPEPLRRFLTQLDLSAVSYCFAIINAGGNPGLGMKHLDEALKMQGGSLDYSGFLRQGSNYIVAPYYTAMNYQAEKLEANCVKNSHLIESMVEDIVERRKNRPQLSSVGFGFTRLMYGLQLRDNRLNLAKDFSASTDCRGCGICSQVCPADNIEICSGVPQWDSECEDCCACIQLCPSEAILLKGKRLHKKRFLHPEVTLKEIIEGNRVVL